MVEIGELTALPIHVQLRRREGAREDLRRAYGSIGRGGNAQRGALCQPNRGGTSSQAGRRGIPATGAAVVRCVRRPDHPGVRRYPTRGTAVMLICSAFVYSAPRESALPGTAKLPENRRAMARGLSRALVGVATTGR